MALLLLLFVPAAFSMNPVIARALVGDVQPGTLTVVRWLLAGLLVGAIALARGRRERWRVPAGEAGRLLVLGALGMGFCSYAAYAGVQTTTATTVGLIYACTSALVMLVEIARGRVAASLTLLAGVVACLAGVVVVLTRGAPGALLTLQIGAGELWAAAGTAGWAAYTIAMTSRPAVQTPFAQFVLMSAAGAVACVVPAAVETLSTGWPTIGPTTPWWIAALVLVASAGAFISYNVSIATNGPILTSASLSLNPLFIAVAAIVLIGEDVRWYHVAATVLVVAGLGLINLDRSRARRAG